MDKKYQIFISSTYEDLKEERKKVIEAILTMNHFPVGMEMFSAADEEQWEIISETIDVSDYYVLIVGNRYGSIIQNGEDAGISYTEKEFRYALKQGIPVLAFVIADDASNHHSFPETDPEKAMKIATFKQVVKTGSVVKFWHNADELASQLTASLYKAISRNKIPGWIRTTEVDVEKSLAEITRLTERVHTLEALNADLKLENNRKPELFIRCKNDITEDGEVANDITIENEVIKFKVQPVSVEDALDGIVYKDCAGKECRAKLDEVRNFRHLCKNGFSVLWHIENNGNARATGVRVKMEFPNELLVISMSELMDKISEEPITFASDAYEGWNARFFEPDSATEKGEKLFLTIDELTTTDEIADLLDPAESENGESEGYEIFPSEVEYRNKKIQHLSKAWFRGVYIVPLAPGKHEIKCSILCNEHAEPMEQIIAVEVE